MTGAAAIGLKSDILLVIRRVIADAYQDLEAAAAAPAPAAVPAAALAEAAAPASVTAAPAVPLEPLADCVGIGGFGRREGRGKRCGDRMAARQPGASHRCICKCDVIRL